MTQDWTPPPPSGGPTDAPTPPPVEAPTPPAAPPSPTYTWQQPVEPVGPAPGVRFGSYGGRLAAYIVDAIAIGVLTAVAAVLLTFVFVVFVANGSDALAGLSILLLLVAVFGISVGYFPYFWATRGQTPGMRLFGLRVVRDRDGGPVTAGQAVLRFIGFIINSAAIYIGWIWIFVDARRRGWHDLIAGTVVIEG